jgi:hypothetical protein
MFEKFGRLAEGLATKVSTSRRGFLGRVGHAAVGVVGALGALAVTAAADPGSVVCCKYRCSNRPYRGHHDFTVCQAAGTTCLETTGTCYLMNSTTKSDCSKC